MTWASLLALLRAIGEAVSRFIRWRESRDNQELGRLRERERIYEANADMRDAIDRASADRVSDDDAFGR